MVSHCKPSLCSYQSFIGSGSACWHCPSTSKLLREENLPPPYFKFFNNTDGPPYDGAALSALHPNHKALVVIYSMAAACGLVYTVVCLVFNVAFGRKK